MSTTDSHDQVQPHVDSFARRLRAAHSHSLLALPQLLERVGQDTAGQCSADCRPILLR